MRSDPGTASSESNGRKQCIVYANGHQKDDVPNILHAFRQCDNSETIVFPQDQSYWIVQRLNPIINDDDRMARSMDSLQNHHASVVLTGGINSNSDIWYTAETGYTQPGRPIPFVLWSISDVTVKSLLVKQPPLGSINIMNGTGMAFYSLLYNVMVTKAPYGSKWPAPTNIEVRIATCRGGNGMTIGSMGQYSEGSNVENAVVSDVDPCGGGGWGSIRNVLFANFNIQGESSNNGSYSGTSPMDIRKVAASVSGSEVHPWFGVELKVNESMECTGGGM
ncbi:glycoside hydrolase family 28 protein [Lepidopterella palustris CBS 459.81]|uniref:galacturonan 1,4-alpha-galacturonidase n=1 Tax=Lepidopterella palustris CBS 459.81 TaxID=1314670 RepID=A0A8E2JI26_9PEZI|nr:glycoside hydrolase family 28 protein [Lepidopterella palustris CBS 459.81]